MHAALLALLLLAATVDPRLVEPLQILAEAEAHEETDGGIGPLFADLPEQLGLTLAMAELPPGAGGRYEPRSRTVTVSLAVIDEDPRVVAVVLAHELQHAIDFKRRALGLLDISCAALEVRAFEAQARVTRLLWPDELPSRTPWERGLAGVIRDLDQGGPAAVAARLGASPGYRESCAL